MKEILLANLDKLHTTDFGKVRLQKNLLLREENPVLWAKGLIQRSETKISHKEKNFFLSDSYIVLAIHTSSYTIIIGHKEYRF